MNVGTVERPRPHPAVETAFLAPEAVLWDARHHQVHHLNPSASAVWLLIDGELTADQIASEVSEIFGADYDVVRPDVDEAIGEFVRRGLLVGDVHGAHDHPSGDTHDHDDGSDASVEDADLGTRSEVGGVVPLPRPPDP